MCVHACARELLEGGNELRLLLCRDKFRGTKNPGTSVLAACGALSVAVFASVVVVVVVILAALAFAGILLLKELGSDLYTTTELPLVASCDLL